MINKKNATTRGSHSVSTRGQKYYSEDELVALIQSLNREEDDHIFEQDVLLTYPHLAESYMKICPQRCDLATAVAKALNGDYSYSPNLVELRDDLQLMVNNCVRFNGSESPLAEIAERFESFFNKKLDEFMESKTGGRRISSLRLQQLRQEAQKTSAVTHKAPTTNPAPFSNRDIVNLANSLVRREDAGAFVVDVAESYPELRESYNVICPKPMNLKIVKERAQAGYYTRPAATTPNANLGNSTTSALKSTCLGSTVADSLASLREDVELIVNNCIRFNEQIESWVTLARSFQKFAQGRIDDFVLRQAPELRGTETGAARYCPREEEASGADDSGSIRGPQRNSFVNGDLSSAERHQSQNSLATQEDASEEVSPEKQVTVDDSSATMNSVKAARSSNDKKKKKLEWAEILAQPLLVHTYEGVQPDIKLSPLQPSLRIPNRLRRRIVVDYFFREQIGLRLIGNHVWMPNLGEVQDSNVDSIEDIVTQKSIDNAKKLTNHEERTSSTEEFLVEKRMSAQAVLDSFVKSVREFYHNQRSRSDFEDVFEYSVEDEAIYMRVLNIIDQQFRRLLPFALLYEKEAAELHAWSSQHAIKTILSTERESKKQRVEATSLEGGREGHGDEAIMHQASDKSDDSEIAEEEDCGKWNPSEHIHYSYLIRFLVHFPQMASLCCANRGDTVKGASTTPVTTLRIQKCLLDVIKQVTRVVEELLIFIDRYEQELELVLG